MARIITSVSHENAAEFKGCDIGVAVVGFGFSGRTFHAPLVTAVPGLKLEVIMQRRGDEAEKLYPAVRVVRTYDEVLLDPRIRLVVISTPNDTHYPLARRALDKGKHVVIERPFTTISKHAEELALLSAERRLKAIPFHNRRWDGDLLTVRELIADETVGRLVTFESRVDQFRPVIGRFRNEVGDRGKGVLFDHGLSLVDQAMAVFGMPHAITASVRKERDATATADAFDICLHYLIGGRSVLAQCSVRSLACDPSPRFLLQGTLGTFTKYGLDPQENAMLNGVKIPKLGSEDPWLEEPKGAWGKLTIAPRPENPTALVRSLVPTIGGDYRGFYQNVRDAINGKTELVTAEDGYRVIRLLELANQSSLEGRTVKIHL